MCHAFVGYVPFLGIFVLFFVFVAGVLRRDNELFSRPPLVWRQETGSRERRRLFDESLERSTGEVAWRSSSVGVVEMKPNAAGAL